MLKYFFLFKVNSKTEIPNNKIHIDLRLLGNKIRANNNAKKNKLNQIYLVFLLISCLEKISNSLMISSIILGK